MCRPHGDRARPRRESVDSRLRSGRALFCQTMVRIEFLRHELNACNSAKEATP